MRTYKLANNWIYQQEQGGAVIPAKLVKSSPENANGSTSRNQRLFLEYGRLARPSPASAAQEA